MAPQPSPAAARLKSEATAARLEQLAQRYLPGSGSVRIDALGSGLTNSSYRVSRDGRLFSLRIAAPRASELGLDRSWECRVLRCAAGAGLAPAVERCEPKAGILVTRWVEGRSLSAGEVASRGNLAKVAVLVRRVHGLPALVRPRILNPGQWIAYYRRALRRRRGGELLERPHRLSDDLEETAQSLIEAVGADPPATPVLCHSDLHAQNLIIVPGGEPVILDWEYAHISDPWWDLAAWACNGDLSAERQRLLLHLYLGRAPTTAQAERLRRLSWLYDYVCLLWSELYSSSRSDAGEAARDAPGKVVSARAKRLADRLRRNR
jgi:thiamine kinase-like enzyme